MNILNKTTSEITALVLRISFGISLLAVGLSHYMTFAAFKPMVVSGLGPLEFLGVIWAFILPALMILGGATFVIGKFEEVAVLASGIALGSIPAGMLLKPVLTGVSLADMMPAAVNAFVWIIVFVLVVKMTNVSNKESS